MIGLGKASPKLDHKTGFKFVRKKNHVVGCCTFVRDASLKTDNPIVFCGPSSINREEVVFRHGAEQASVGPQGL